MRQYILIFSVSNLNVKTMSIKEREVISTACKLKNDKNGFLQLPI